MRVAFLAWRDLSHPEAGGSEVFVEEVARRLVQRGHVVTVVSAEVAGAPAEETVAGVRVVRRGSRLGVYPAALAWLVRHRREVDVVVDVLNGIPFATPLVRRHGVVALTHHSHREQWHLVFPGLLGHLGWFLERRVTPLLYRGRPHLTVSRATRRDLVARGYAAQDVTVVRNGLTVVASSARRSPTPRLVVVARLVPHKRIEHALVALARLRPRFPDLVLDVVGEGWDRERLEGEVRRLDLGAAVVLHGHVPDRVRDDLLARAWVSLLPSVREGWGLVLVEAAAQGTPSIAYRSAGGVGEAVLDGSTGFLADDLDDLVALTARLLEDPSLRERTGAAARAHAEAHDWSRTTREVEQVLHAAAHGRSGGRTRVRNGRRS